MPLTAKGKKVLAKMRKTYGKKKGTSVFYSSAKKGTIKGVHGKPRSRKSKKRARKKKRS